MARQLASQNAPSGLRSPLSCVCAVYVGKSVHSTPCLSDAVTAVSRGLSAPVARLCSAHPAWHSKHVKVSNSALKAWYLELAHIGADCRGIHVGTALRSGPRHCAIEQRVLGLGLRAPSDAMQAVGGGGAVGATAHGACPTQHAGNVASYHGHCLRCAVTHYIHGESRNLSVRPHRWYLWNMRLNS